MRLWGFDKRIIMGEEGKKGRDGQEEERRRRRRRYSSSNVELSWVDCGEEEGGRILNHGIS